MSEILEPRRDLALGELLGVIDASVETMTQGIEVLKALLAEAEELIDSSRSTAVESAEYNEQAVRWLERYRGLRDAREVRLGEGYE